MDFLPNDLRLSLLQDLTSAPGDRLQSILEDPEVSMILLENL